MEPLVLPTELETTTVTLDEIVYHRRVRALDHAGQTSVSEACRTFGISRTTYYRWADRAARYGLAALMPKGRRSPAMPNAAPPEIIEITLAEAVARPTLGARRLLEHLAERDVVLSASGVQKILNRHRLGRRAQRVAALAQITAVGSGLVTETAIATMTPLKFKDVHDPGSRVASLAMASKLIEAAEQRWRSVNAPHLVALVRAGARFDKGGVGRASYDAGSRSHGVINRGEPIHRS